MKDKVLKRVKIIIGVIIILLISWVFLIKPKLTFNDNEKQIEKATKRYFELNSNELPSGERVKTIKLQKLYDAGLIEKDFYIPLSKKTCSSENSWAKVRRENGEYKYYIYLECGYLKSNVDHEGPVIKLNGEEKMTVSRDTKYNEPGVSSVIDKVDGELKTSDVTIKSNVDTTKTGSYEVTYTAFDKLSNKTTVTRKVKVVRKIYDTIKNDLNSEKNYKGNPENNYVRLSNMIFRIYGYDKDKNVILVADRDIANVNYTKLDEWLKYFYNNLNKNTQKMLVENKYCSMTVDEKNTNKTKCENYTDKKKVYIPSIVEVNNAASGEDNFMKPATMSWVADKKNGKESYVTRDIFFEEEANKSFVSVNSNHNYGVRPMITIKGNSYITDGTGTSEDPYVFGDTKKVKGGASLNTREVGEYVTDGNLLWRIVQIMKDGTTKVVTTESIGGYTDDISWYQELENPKYVYNPKKKSSVAYFINNRSLEFVDTSNFITHEVEVPIYKDNIVYKEEVETKKYNVMLSAPNMYEMFSASTNANGSYWLINTSKKDWITGAITEIGVPYNEEVEAYTKLYIRVVGFYKKDTVISNGKGTEESPYKIK